MLDTRYYEEALLIRRVEETLLHLFSLGKLNGTVHTCVGQEFSAVAFANQLKEGDFIFSNHRCHGHYISFTKDYQGLIMELTGKQSGVCGGIGGSQHLYNKNFYSNGIQGGITPVAAGLALAHKLKGRDNIGLVFIGDGTLGEGVVYETMNIISKWGIPLLIVCENNFYAQSTKIEATLAGDILARPGAFGIKTFKSDTNDVESLFNAAGEAIEYVRSSRKPAFHLVETYRLNAHSKGDDDRNMEELAFFKAKDPLNAFSENSPAAYKELLCLVNSKIDSVLATIDSLPNSDIDVYLEGLEQHDYDVEWEEIETINERMVHLINEFFINEMSTNRNILFIGEDVLSPYGGAFKIAKDLSDKYKDQVFTTPISEAAIIGISNGLALDGFKPFVEIMFGDFITLGLDQILNHASKFYHMYNKRISCPIVIRTPMGGGRGYGPTHSQSLDKFLLGIDNVTTIALNSLTDPRPVLKSVAKELHPVIIIENKLDYGRSIAKKRIKNFSFLRSDSDYPVIRISPKGETPHFTLVTYGGNVTIVLEAIEELFYEHELLGEVIVLTKIHPIDKIEYSIINSSAHNTKQLFVVEEGSGFAGFGSEILANVAENSKIKIEMHRIASLPVPIPSSSVMEKHILVNAGSIVNSIKNKIGQ